MFRGEASDGGFESESFGNLNQPSSSFYHLSASNRRILFSSFVIILCFSCLVLSFATCLRFVTTCLRSIVVCIKFIAAFLLAILSHFWPQILRPFSFGSSGLAFSHRVTFTAWFSAILFLCHSDLRWREKILWPFLLCQSWISQI